MLENETNLLTYVRMDRGLKISIVGTLFNRQEMLAKLPESHIDSQHLFDIICC